MREFLNLPKSWPKRIALFGLAVFFVQVKEDVAQAAMRESDRYLQVTRDVLVEYGGLWFVNETFSVRRKHRA